MIRHVDTTVSSPTSSHAPAQFTSTELAPHDLTTRRRAVIVLGSSCIVPADDGASILRAPEGAEPLVEGQIVTPDRAGAYVFGSSLDSTHYAAVVVPPEALDVPGLGAAPLLTLLSLAQHPEAFPDARWDELATGEHANPFYGCPLEAFGGARPTLDPNSGERRDNDHAAAWRAIAARKG